MLLPLCSSSKTPNISPPQCFTSAPASPVVSRDLATVRRNPFRMTTCKSVTKQITITPFRINTYTKTGGRGVILLTNTRSLAPSPFKQPTKQFGHLSRPHVPRAVANRLLPLLPLGKRVRGKRFFHHRHELFGRPVDSDPRRVQVFIQRRNHHGLTGCEGFPDLNGAPVAGKCVFLVPRQHAHIDVTVIEIGRAHV